MASKKVLIEWRTDDKWYGTQQRIKRSDILPEGPLEITQKVRVRFSRRWHDAVTVESWMPTSKRNGPYTSKQKRRPEREIESSESDDDLPLQELLSKNQTDLACRETVSTNVNEKSLYDQYISQRNDQLTRPKEPVQLKDSCSVVCAKKRTRDSEVLEKKDLEPSTHAKKNKNDVEEAINKQREPTPIVIMEQETKEGQSKAAKTTSSPKAPEPNIQVDSTREGDNVAEDPFKVSADAFDRFLGDSMWETSMDDRIVMQQISEDVRAVKDGLQVLNTRMDNLDTTMSMVHARLDAIEAAICLVPFSLHESSSPAGQSMNSVIESLPQKTKTTSTITSPVNTTSDLSSSTLSNTLVSTPVTPTHRQQLPSSISPIVSSLPTDKAHNLKESQKKAKSRKQYTRKCMDELFTSAELSTSNVNGSGGKQKLDEYKVGLINRLVLAAFPATPGVEDVNAVEREVRDTINMKCREKLKYKQLQHIPVEDTV